MPNKIEYFKKNVYGQEMLYIADKRQADLIQALTGRKTVTYTEFKILNELSGLEFVQVIN